MAVRGLIVGIEDYSSATDLPVKLKGTNKAADDFLTWLLQVKHVQDTDVRYCCASPRPGRTAGATRENIIDELMKLVAQGRDDTQELYVFFSGHGFSYPEHRGRRPVDILVASNFTNLDRAGLACLKLDEMQEKLQAALGPGDHFYFVDSCRTILDRDVALMDLGPDLGVSDLGSGCLYTLYSTSQGATARADSGFARRVIDGLKGVGRAKGWHRRKLYVKFETLKNYVRDSVKQEADASVLGTCDGLILPLEPPPRSQCKIEVVNAETTDRFRLIVQDGKEWSQEYKFTGRTYAVEVPPEEYAVTVVNPSSGVRRIDPPPPDSVDLWDSRVVRFRKEGPPGAVFPQPPAGFLDAGGISGYEIAALRLQSPDDLITATDFGVANIAPGFYRVDLMQQGIVLDSRHVRVRPGDTVRAQDVFSAPTDRLRAGILQATGNPVNAIAIDFSETLGPIPGRNLGLWLSILGASRIVGPYGDWSKLGHLPLATLDHVQPGASAVYVLAGFENVPQSLHVALGSNIRVNWREMAKVDKMPGMWQMLVDFDGSVGGGPLIFSYSIDCQTPMSIATHRLPNRATLITLTEGDQGETEVHQYILPIHSLIPALEPLVRERLQDQFGRDRPLRFIRFLWQVQRDFALKRKIDYSGADIDGIGDKSRWLSFLYGKWLDPIMALMATYELIRRGALKSDRSSLQEALRNLKTYFAGIPDIQAIAKLMDAEWERPPSPPLVVDGLVALGQTGTDQGLLGGKLIYGGLWTSWRGLVNAVEASRSSTPSAVTPPKAQPPPSPMATA
jgi:hypothetical protein